MKCPNCGSQNPSGMKFCGQCGKSLAEGKSSDESASRNRHCVKCGRMIEWDATFCPYCGHDFAMRKEEDVGPKVQPLMKNATVGGILAILAGLISIFLLVFIYLETHKYTSPSTVSYDWMIYTLLVVMASLGITGGFAALARKYYEFAVVGSACAVIGPGFFFALLGVIIISGAAAEFEERMRKSMPTARLESVMPREQIIDRPPPKQPK